MTSFNQQTLEQSCTSQECPEINGKFWYCTIKFGFNSPPVEGFNWNKETTWESSDSCDDGRETEGLGGEGTDQGDEESYPSLVEGNVGEDHLEVDKEVVRRSIHQLCVCVCVE